MDLERRVHRNQELEGLSRMSFVILQAVMFNAFATTISGTTITQVDLGRRLVEYFVVISSVEQGHNEKKGAPHNGEIDWKTESSFEQDEDDIFAEYNFKPVITARYPLRDHPDNPLHESIAFVCHPSGGIQLRTEHYMPKVGHHDPVVAQQ